MSSDFHTHKLAAAGRALISAEHPVPGKLVSLEVHPWKIDANFMLPADLAERLAQCAALGEIGYDGLHGDAKRQLEILPELLKIAADQEKPVVLHLVRPSESVFHILDRFPLRYLIHGFRGKAEKLAHLLDKEYFVSLGVRALEDHGVAEFLHSRGLARIGFETDAGSEKIGEVLKFASARLGFPKLERITDATFDEFIGFKGCC